MTIIGSLFGGSIRAHSLKSVLFLYVPNFSYTLISCINNKNLHLNSADTNSKIHDNLDTFSDVVSSEKEKNAVVLLVLERIAGKDHFKKSAVFDATDEDIRIAVANEIVYDVELIIKKEIRENEKKGAKLKEIISLVNNSTKSRETTEIIAIKIEEFFDLYEINDIKNVSGLQNIIKQYIDFNKQINRRPSATGLKFIDEYNRITKNK